MADKKSTKSSPSETIEKDQDDLMSTLESIRGLLEQSEGKLNAARESISIANTNTKNDTSTLLHLRNNDEEIVPILDEIVEPGIILEEPVSLTNLETANIKANELPEAELEIPEPEIPELDSIVLSTNELSDSSIVLDSDLTLPVSDNDAISEAAIGTSANEIKPANDLASLTQKNLLIDAIDRLQAELEESLREQLMKTMVSLEKDLKDKIAHKIEQIKSDIID